MLATLPLGPTSFDMHSDVEVRILRGTLQVLLSFSLPFLAFSLRVCVRTQCLNGFTQAHALGSSVHRAIGCGLRSRTGHIRPQAIKRDAQILADVGCGHALADVLESCTCLR